MTTSAKIRERELWAESQGQSLRYAILLGEFIEAVLPRIMQLDAENSELRQRNFEISNETNQLEAAKNKPEAERSLRVLESRIRVLGRSIYECERGVTSEVKRWSATMVSARKSWAAASGCLSRYREKHDLKERNGEPARADTSPQQ